MPLFSDFKAVLIAGRFWKNLPLIITFLSGIFFAEQAVIPPLRAIAGGVICVMLLSFFMTHVNVITDYELDKKRKPHLYNSLFQNPGLARTIIWSEALVSILLSGWLWHVGYAWSALSMMVFGLAATLYSYNFLWPFGDAPTRHRFKVYWWGHAMVVVIGYVSLWFAGAYLSNPAPQSTQPWWLLYFVFISVSEYSVFLLESSIDSKEEKEHEIKSLSAILGYLNTNRVAVAVNLIATIGFAITLLYSSETPRLLICFIPPMLVRLAYEIYMLNILEGEKRYRLLRDIPDILFNATRVYILVTLIFV